MRRPSRICRRSWCRACLLPVLALRPSSHRPGRSRASRPTKAATRTEAAKAATDRPRRSHQGRGAQAVAGHGDPELPDRRDRAPADRLAEHEAGQRVDPRQAGGVGPGNAHLEAWGPFGRGWTLKRFSAQVIEPQCIPLIAYPKAWSPGTEGTLVGPGRLLRRQDRGRLRPVQGEAQGRDRADEPGPRGRRRTSSRWRTRKTDSELLALADAAEPDAPRPRRPAQAGHGPRRASPQRRAAMPQARPAATPRRQVGWSR